MFYSHTFLARKSPLGTVWIAAHLQHKLRRSHVTVTDIPSSVDCIMFPEVPIALRLSAHLLLGVVRIYSKKVDYLCNDCHAILNRIKNAFGSVDVNLPEDATHAPFHSVTLPDTFELDAWDLDDELYREGLQDNHLKSHEEITITDQIPGEGNPYIAFFIDEDIRMDISPPAEIPEIGVRPMEEDAPPSVQVDSSVGISDPGSSNQAEQSNQRLYEDIISQGLPEIEVMRDAVNNSGSENLQELPDLSNDAFEQNRVFNHMMNDKETLTPIMEDVLVSGEQSVPFQLHSEPPNSVATEAAPDVFGSHFSLGHKSPELAIQPTPPVEKQKARPRKRKQFYDQSVVLTNESIKKGLKDPSGLLRQRKKLPCADLDVWRFNNRSRVEQVFLEPSISGLCTNLKDIFRKDFISSKVDLIPEENALPESRDAQFPAPDLDMEIECLRFEEGHVGGTSFTEFISSKVDSIPVKVVLPESRDAQSPAPDLDMEIESLRFEESHVGGSSFTEFMPSSSRLMTTQSRREDFTPFPVSSLGSEPPSEMFGTEVLPTPDLEGSSEPFGSELETPMTRLEDQLGIRDSGLYDIPELLNSAEAEDLHFLEAYDTPTGHRENEEVDTMSIRTRAVAQYLKRQSPTTELSKEQSGNLSLSKILEGKTRNLCARLFFETLVLKSCGLIDVQQDEAYGDITLMLTQRLSKAQL